MEKKRKNFAINASALIIVFAVMVAALAYDPQGSARGSFAVEVHGFVFDENGRPIENARVGVNNDGTYSSANGSYSFTCNYSDMFIPDLDHNNDNIIGAYAEGHWEERQYLDVTDAKSYEINFTLSKNENMTVPLGVLVYPNIINDSTLVNISVKLSICSLYASVDGEPLSGSIGPFYGPYSIPIDISEPMKFSMEATSSTPVQLCMNATVTGTYYGGGHINSVSIYQNGPIFAKSLGSDRLNHSDVSSNCTTFQLTMGESKDIGAIEPYVGYNERRNNLPDVPSLSFNVDLLGKKVTFQEIGLYNMNGAQDWYISHVVTVTVEPLIPGDHTYALYLENGCIIHIWELGAG